MMLTIILKIKIMIMTTGSGGLAVSKWLNISFIQEVISSTKAIEKYYPTDVVIELGRGGCQNNLFIRICRTRMTEYVPGQ